MSSKAHFDYMDAVEAALTDKVLLRLQRFAEGRCKLLRSHGLAGNAHDMAHDAVQDTFEGTRPWNPKKCELHQHLQGVVSSRVSNIFRHAAVARFQAMGVHGSDDEEDPVEVAATLASEPVIGAEQRLINHDLAGQIVAALSELAKGSNDRQVLGMIDAWREGVTEREDVAERLGLSTKRVKAARQRLLRLVDKLPEPLREGSAL